MKDDKYTTLAKQGLPIEGLVIDAHMHLGEHPPFPILHPDDVDLFVHEMDRHGMDVACPSAIPAVLGGIQPGGNAVVLEAGKHSTTSPKKPQR